MSTSTIERLFRHSEEWGKVWFGVLFWGSVLGAGIQAFAPEIPTGLAYGVAIAAGAKIGLIAKARGRWI